MNTPTPELEPQADLTWRKPTLTELDLAATETGGPVPDETDQDVQSNS